MSDRQWMFRALELAERGQGAVEPNPMVGCVLVQADQVIAEGWHRRFGDQQYRWCLKLWLHGNHGSPHG